MRSSVPCLQVRFWYRGKTLHTRAELLQAAAACAAPATTEAERVQKVLVDRPSLERSLRPLFQPCQLPQPTRKEHDRTRNGSVANDLKKGT